MQENCSKERADWQQLQSSGLQCCSLSAVVQGLIPAVLRTARGSHETIGFEPLGYLSLRRLRMGQLRKHSRNICRTQPGQDRVSQAPADVHESMMSRNKCGLGLIECTRASWMLSFGYSTHSPNTAAGHFEQTQQVHDPETGSKPCKSKVLLRSDDSRVNASAMTKQFAMRETACTLNPNLSIHSVLQPFIGYARLRAAQFCPAQEIRTKPR